MIILSFKKMTDKIRKMHLSNDSLSNKASRGLYLLGPPNHDCDCYYNFKTGI